MIVTTHKKIDLRRKVAYVLSLFSVLLFLWGCRNDMGQVKFFDRQKLPDQMLYNADITHSEYGRVQMRMTAPVVAQYTSPEQKTIYPEGVKMVFFDESLHKSAYISAKYASTYDNKGLTMVKDSVVIIDFNTHDTIYLEDMIWSKNEGRVYSRHLVEAHNGQRITYGDGFESDDNFDNLRIIHQRGTVEVKDEPMDEEEEN